MEDDSKVKKKKKEQTPDIFSNMDESLTWGKSTQMQKTIYCLIPFM